MADDRNANVVISADVSGYTQGTQEAYNQTNVLIGAVDKLATSLDGITKRAGKKLMLFGAADMAAMTGAVAIAANFDKQLQTLNAQATLTGQSIDKYKLAISDAARAMPVARGEIVALTTQIAKLGVQTPKTVEGLTNNFIKLGAATGESSAMLAQGMIGLSRQMGTFAGGAKQMQNFSDSLVKVTASAGVSAQGVVEFSQSIAPFARAAGIGEKQLLGISTAFVKAGSDGYSAANTMSQMLADITRQVQSGSPEIAKYSNLIGVTIDQFKAMDPTERVVQIFERLGSAGPDAIKMLDRLGYDGIRAAKAIQTVASEGGNLRKYINEAVGAYGSGATQQGADAAFSGLNDTMTKIRNNMEQIGESIGSAVLPVVEKMAQGFNSVLSVVNSLASPLLAVGGALAALLGPVSGAGGLLMSGLGAASTIALGATALRATPLKALIGGVRQGRVGMMPDDSNEATQRYTRGMMRWDQRAGYRLGLGIGSFFPQDPEDRAQARPGSLGRIMRSAISSPFRVATAFMNANTQFYNDAARVNAWQRSAPIAESLGRAGTRMSGFGTALGTALAHPRQFLGGLRNAWADPESKAAIKGMDKTSIESVNKAADTAAKSMQRAAVATGATITANQTLARSVGGTTAAFARMTLAANRAAAANIAMAGWQGTKAIGGSLMGFMGGPVGMALMAGMGVAAIGSAISDSGQLNTEEANAAGGVNALNVALGRAVESVKTFSDVLDETSGKGKPVTIEEALTISERDRTRRIGHEVSDKALGKIAPGQFGSYLRSQGQLDADQLQEEKLNALALGFSERDVQAGLDEYKASIPTQPGVKPAGAGKTDIAGLVRSSMERAQSGWFDEMFSINPSDETMAANRAIVTSINQAGQAAPEGAQAQTMANLTKTAIGEAIDARAPTWNITRMANDEWSPQQEDIIRRLIQNTTGMTDEEAQGISVYGMMKKAGIGAEQVNTMSGEELGQQFMNYIAKAGEEDLLKNSGNATTVEGRMWSALRGSGVDVGPTSDVRQQTLTNQFQGWYDPASPEGQLRATALGQYARTNEKIWAATEGTDYGNPNAQIQAMDLLAQRATDIGGSFAGATTELEKMKSVINSVDDPLYQLAEAARGLLAAFEEVRLSEIGRANAWKSRYETSQARIEAAGPGPQGMEIRKEEIQNQLGIKADMENFLRGWIQTARNFSIQMKRSAEDYQYSVDITNRNYYQQLAWQEADHYRSRKWAQEDFQRQMKYSEEDYLRSRLYAQQDYELQVKRANRDFNRQMAYSQEDYHRSRAREERNFNRQMRYMSEDMAKSIYDPWKRVSIGYTTSTRTLISNLQEQVRIFRRQTEELDQLREMGMSQQAIDVLGLGDPQKWAQVHRMIQTGTAEEIASINSLVAERGQVSDDLLMNPENNQALRRQLEERAQMLLDQEEDFTLSIGRSQLAFDTSMADMAKNYATGTARQHEQYLIGLARSTDAYRLQMERDEILYRQGLERAQILHEQALKDMATQYEKAMRRAKKDLQRYGEEVTGGLNELYEKAIKWQKKLLGDETVAALDAIGGLKDSVLDALNELDGQHLTWTVDVSTNVSTGAGGYPSSTANPDYGGQGGYGHSAGYTGGGSGVAGNAGQTGQAGSVSSHTTATLAELEMWQVAVAKRMPDAYPSYVKKDKGKFYALTQGLGSQGPMWVTVPAQFFGSTSVWKDNWWKQYAYLAEGGVVTQPTNAVVGEGGPEAVVPLNEAGGDFIAKFIRQVAANLESDAPKSTDEEQLRVLKQSNQRLGAMLVLTDEANLFRKEFGADVTKGFEDLGKTTVEVGAKIVKALDKIPGEQPNKDPEGEGGNTPGITPGKPSKPAKPNTNKPPKPQSDTMTYDPYDPHDVTTYPGVSTSRMVSSISKTVVQELMTSGFATPVNGTLGAGGNVTINNNTTFTGITVQAQDPNAMARALKQKEKLANIRRGANAASAN